MKRVISVSLGSSKRDHRVQVALGGEDFEIARRGTDGDMEKAIEIIKELDGTVDAIGLGGIDVYVYAGTKRYALSDGLRLLRSAQKTPVVDGSGLKNTLERKAVRYLMDNTGLVKPGTKVLMVSAVDRFGMAQAFNEARCNVNFGDLIFVLGIPCRIKSIKTLETLGRTLIPFISKLPFNMLYPTGENQGKDNNRKKYYRYYYEADIIAGDFHYIRKFFPPRLDGKVIITNTTTGDDIDFLKKRGISTLITTTPVLEGRSFGTNVMEGVLVALAEKNWDEVTANEYSVLLDKIGFKPHITNFQEKNGSGTA